MKMIELNQVTLKYDNDVVFKGLDFQLEQGQCCCVHTGVLDGGSSLLRLCAGLAEPDSGEVLLGGKRPAEYSDDELFKLVSLCPEDKGMISIFGNLNNLLFPMAYHFKINAQEVMEEIFNMTSLLGISELLDKEPHQLNDVQHRLFNLARALVIKPEIILIDELQAGFSHEIREKVIGVVLEQQKKNSYTIVMTVSAGDAVDFADSIFSIKNNKLEQIK